MIGLRLREVFLGEQIGHRKESSQETARIVDEAMEAILISASDRDYEFLQGQHAKLDKLAGFLMEKELLSGEKVLALVNGHQIEEAETVVER